MQSQLAASYRQLMITQHTCLGTHRGSHRSGDFHFHLGQLVLNSKLHLVEMCTGGHTQALRIQPWCLTNNDGSRAREPLVFSSRIAPGYFRERRELRLRSKAGLSSALAIVTVAHGIVMVV